ncbi:hypothetical protein C479_03271 [Halovivax asiaticus JCM 14624]|uniref:Uncharacterized protein n=1 Tax=Halovivax asiaticus JCM 14624 TaxID=1227490 RepID=M0BTV3_9EURY|nr:hypothetical protein [Halovivax asiaticus]ELZ13833.1 hypothetical protein C479_03271 [Halovivax asiaticus JCM 14624]
MNWLLTMLGVFSVLVGAFAIVRPETAIDLQRTHGPDIAANRDDDFVDDMVRTTPWAGATLVVIGVAILVFSVG